MSVEQIARDMRLGTFPNKSPLTLREEAGKSPITKAQWKALAKIVKHPGTRWDVPFRTGEALRRLGLVERHSYRLLRYDFADKNGEHKQCVWTAKEPGIWHEWYPTLDGEMLIKP